MPTLATCLFYWILVTSRKVQARNQVDWLRKTFLDFHSNVSVLSISLVKSVVKEARAQTDHHCSFEKVSFLRPPFSISWGKRKLKEPNFVIKMSCAHPNTGMHSLTKAERYDKGSSYLLERSSLSSCSWSSCVGSRHGLGSVVGPRAHQGCHRHWRTGDSLWIHAQRKLGQTRSVGSWIHTQVAWVTEGWRHHHLKVKNRSSMHYMLSRSNSRSQVSINIITKSVNISYLIVKERYCSQDALFGSPGNAPNANFKAVSKDKKRVKLASARHSKQS